jgi:hypothetical protein
MRLKKKWPSRVSPRKRYSTQVLVAGGYLHALQAHKDTNRLSKLYNMLAKNALKFEAGQHSSVSGVFNVTLM